MQVIILICLILVGGSDLGAVSVESTDSVRVSDYSGDYDCSEASDYSGVDECI
jgi:hypothetical protein